MLEDAYRRLSLWHDSVPGPLEPRPPLRGDKEVDVATVGAGYTGLWTAYYLTEREPSLRIAIVEAEIAGLGAETAALDRRPSRNARGGGARYGRS